MEGLKNWRSDSYRIMTMMPSPGWALRKLSKYFIASSIDTPVSRMLWYILPRVELSSIVGLRSNALTPCSSCPEIVNVWHFPGPAQVDVAASWVPGMVSRAILVSSSMAVIQLFAVICGFGWSPWSPEPPEPP